MTGSNPISSDDLTSECSDNSFKNAIKENKRLLRENEDLNQKLKLKKQQDLTDKIKARRIIA